MKWLGKFDNVVNTNIKSNLVLISESNGNDYFITKIFDFRSSYIILNCDNGIKWAIDFRGDVDSIDNRIRFFSLTKIKPHYNYDIFIDCKSHDKKDFAHLNVKTNNGTKNYNKKGTPLGKINHLPITFQKQGKYNSIDYLKTFFSILESLNEDNFFNKVLSYQFFQINENLKSHNELKIGINKIFNL